MLLRHLLVDSRKLTCLIWLPLVVRTIGRETSLVPEQTEVWMDPRYPWTFDNDLFGGPDFWGLVHKNWRMCNIGRLQSPINIDPGRLYFDPGLTRLSIARSTIEATFLNTGQLPLVTLDGGMEKQHSTLDTIARGHPDRHKSHSPVNITGGPAYPYTYQLHQVVFHYGRGYSNLAEEESDLGGSEHTINGARFPAELQLMAYNSDLYENFSQAMFQPRGLLGISIVVDIGDTTNSELRKLTVASQSVTYKKSKMAIRKFHPSSLLPKHSDHYVTYEGSLTYPGCYETVTWAVMNNPIYISREDLAIWGELQQVEKNMSSSRTAGSTTSPSSPLYISPNYRPLQPENGRLVRTNINVEYRSRVAGSLKDSCPSNIYLDTGYRAKSKKSNNVSSAQSSRVRVLPDAIVPKNVMKGPINHYVYS